MTAKNEANNANVQLDAQHRLYIALVVGIAAFFGFRNLTSAPELILLIWICFGMSLIVMQWIVILTAHPREIIKIAKLQDSSRSLIFLFVIGASLVSLGAILFLLKSPKSASDAQTAMHVLVSLGAVFVSWWLVHTVFTMRYAHDYYDTTTDNGQSKPACGLNFPDEDEPDYMDFVYFSFVIGMTFQVSDVEISSKHIRRLAWAHGLISFAFNTAIVALSINIISGLVSH
ncbi:DUF1345 domain-containing protein [Mucilaginibacter koreensis]